MMDAFWALCLQHFEQSLPHQQYKTWILPLQARLSGRNLVVQAPNRFVLQWVKDRFLPVIEQLAHDQRRVPYRSLELAQRRGRLCSVSLMQ
jgi:chromosomal replication initiator protein